MMNLLISIKSSEVESYIHKSVYPNISVRKKSVKKICTLQLSLFNIMYCDNRKHLFIKKSSFKSKYL